MQNGATYVAEMSCDKTVPFRSELFKSYGKAVDAEDKCISRRVVSVK
jgi:hypothetical protein